MREVDLQTKKKQSDTAGLELIQTCSYFFAKFKIFFNKRQLCCFPQILFVFSFLNIANNTVLVFYCYIPITAVKTENAQH